MRQSDAGVDLTPAQRLAASTGQKAMMPIGASAPRPFLDYVISAVADAGCRDVCLVVAPDHDAIRRHYTVDARPRRVTITFAVQDEPLGTAHAVRARPQAARISTAAKSWRRGPRPAFLTGNWLESEAATCLLPAFMTA